MALQTTLFSPKLEAAFNKWHAANPHVYDKIEEFALAALASGRGRFSISMIYERIRWWSRFETTGEPWKLNNSYRAFYSRMLMTEHPELVGVLEIRESVADLEGVEVPES